MCRKHSTKCNIKCLFGRCIMSCFCWVGNYTHIHDIWLMIYFYFKNNLPENNKILFNHFWSFGIAESDFNKQSVFFPVLKWFSFPVSGIFRLIKTDMLRIGPAAIDFILNGSAQLVTCQIDVRKGTEIHLPIDIDLY